MLAQTVYWSRITIEDWAMYSAATDKGICYIGTPGAPFEEVENFVKKHMKQAQLIERSAVFKQCEEELRQYYAGTLEVFTTPLDLYGTVFQQQVWRVLQHIPYGKTLSYLDVAEKINNPRAVRAVGGAIGANPVLVYVPCHRIITKDGKLGGFRAGLSMKRRLLDVEQIELKGGEKI